MADSGYFDVAHSHEDVLTVRWDELEEDELWRRLERYKAGDPSRASTHGSVSPTTPLFPPSPPGKCTKHPVQILARALRRAQEQNARLERELKRYKTKGADEVSIHDGLTEALSTSLGEESASTVPTPRPALSQRSSSSSLALPAGGQSRPRSSWAASVWNWSAGSTSTNESSSNAESSRPKRIARRPSQKRVSTADELSEAMGSPAEGDDWRKGDGGSSPAFQAIVLATRILTPDPASVLGSLRILPNSLVAYLAHNLVSTAQNEAKQIRDPPDLKRLERQRSRSRASTISKEQESDGSSRTRAGFSDHALAATASLGRSLLSTVSGGTLRPSKSTASASQTVRPTPSRSTTARPTAASVVAQAAAGDSNDASGNTTPSREIPSVELESIIPDESRPPTVVLSRNNLGSFFQSEKARAAVGKMPKASRFSGAEPLTDRYGFIYDIQHASMLRDANVAGAPSPVSLTGVLTARRDEPEEGWIDKQRRRSSTDLDRTIGERRRSRSRLGADLAAARGDDSVFSGESSRDQSPHESPVTEGPVHSPLGDAAPGKERTRHRSSTLMLNPSPAKPQLAQQTLTVSARGGTSLNAEVSATSPQSVSDDLPPHDSPVSVKSAAAASRSTVSSLLDQLTDIHDRQQQARQSEWDAFLKKRRKNQAKSHAGHGDRRQSTDSKWAGTFVGISQLGLAGKAGQEEWKSFTKLVRGGVPLKYRADVWAECSGAKDALVPGEYAEILAVHANDASPVLAEIEKDVSRTFPGNVFFGGDGVGVAKLRRVLIAFSWHNPAVGYCQGMNMLAATLLLTHPEEEQAYWVLVSLIDKLLPADFYAPSLLASRADQRVLQELVAQYIPKLDQHLISLGVDLASVTFGWFLSLFTDCLPVETLFRVWDVFFVEGHDTLFRVAVAILKINEADIIACETAGDLFTFVSSMTSRLWAADKLIQLQHSYKPIIRHTDIEARCERHTVALQQEMGLDE